MGFLFLCVLVTLTWITVNRSIWFVQQVAIRRSDRTGHQARIDRVVRRECAHLDKEYRRLMRR